MDILGATHGKRKKRIRGKHQIIFMLSQKNTKSKKMYFFFNSHPLESVDKTGTAPDTDRDNPFFILFLSDHLIPMRRIQFDT